MAKCYCGGTGRIHNGRCPAYVKSGGACNCKPSRCWCADERWDRFKTIGLILVAFAVAGATYLFLRGSLR